MPAPQAAGRARSASWAAALFVIALLLFIKTQHYILIATTVEIEAIIHRLRVRLMDQVRHSELLPLDAIGRAEIVAAITKETATLTQATNMIAFAGQGVVLVFFVAIYVAYLSLAGLCLSVVIVGAAGAIFHFKSRELAERTREAAKWDNRLFDRLIDLLDGFKEVRLNQLAQRRPVRRRRRGVANGSQHQDPHPERDLQAAGVLAELDVPAARLDRVRGPDLQRHEGRLDRCKTTTALMFVVGVCIGIVQTIPDPDRPPMPQPTTSSDWRRGCGRLPLRPSSMTESCRKRFDKIEMRNVMFRYIDKSSEAVFQVGPVDFTLRSGDLVFITGGNGSGKSTFLKVLAGLYQPDSGKITLDGVRVDDSNRDAYRALIAAIFVDYHLFQRLYGIADPDPAEVDRLLTEFRLRDKTRLDRRRVQHARPLGRPAQAPRAHREPAGEASDPVAGRMDRRSGSGFSAQVLR